MNARSSETRQQPFAFSENDRRLFELGMQPTDSRPYTQSTNSNGAGQVIPEFIFSDENMLEDLSDASLSDVASNYSVAMGVAQPQDKVFRNPYGSNNVSNTQNLQPRTSHLSQQRITFGNADAVHQLSPHAFQREQMTVGTQNTRTQQSNNNMVPQGNAKAAHNFYETQANVQEELPPFSLKDDLEVSDMFDDINDIKEQVFDLLNQYQLEFKQNKSKREIKQKIGNDTANIQKNYNAVLKKYQSRLDVSDISKSDLSVLSSLTGTSQINNRTQCKGDSQKEKEVNMMINLVEEFLLKFSPQIPEENNQQILNKDSVNATPQQQQQQQQQQNTNSNQIPSQNKNPNFSNSTNNMHAQQKGQSKALAQSTASDSTTATVGYGSSIPQQLLTPMFHDQRESQEYVYQSSRAQSMNQLNNNNQFKRNEETQATFQTYSNAPNASQNTQNTQQQPFQSDRPKKIFAKTQEKSGTETPKMREGSLRSSGGGSSSKGSSLNNSEDLKMCGQVLYCPKCDSNFEATAYFQHLEECDLRSTGNFFDNQVVQDSKQQPIAAPSPKKNTFKVENEQQYIADETIMISDGLEQLLTKLNRKIERIKENVAGNIGRLEMPMTTQILQETLDGINRVLHTSDADVAKSVLRRLERQTSELTRSDNGARTYPLYRYLKRIENLLEEKQAVLSKCGENENLQQQLLLLEISRIGRTDSSVWIEESADLHKNQQVQKKQQPQQQYQQQTVSTTPSSQFQRQKSMPMPQAELQQASSPVVAAATIAMKQQNMRTDYTQNTTKARFFEQAQKMKKELPSTHKGNRVLISELYEEAGRQQVPETSWGEYLQRKFQHDLA